jgi:hypothetical protein
MLDIPAPAKTRSNKDPRLTPIDFDYDSSTIEVFLDMISVSHPKLPILDYDACMALYDLCRKYDCPDLSELFKRRLVEKAGDLGAGFELFAYASARDDWSLGRAALKEMDMASVQDLYKSTDRFLLACDHLRPDWERVLLRLLLTKHSVSGSIMLQPDWQAIAEEFRRPRQKTSSRVGKKWGARSGNDQFDKTLANLR